MTSMLVRARLGSVRWTEDVRQKEVMRARWVSRRWVRAMAHCVSKCMV